MSNVKDPSLDFLKTDVSKIIGKFSVVFPLILAVEEKESSAREDPKGNVILE